MKTNKLSLRDIVLSFFDFLISTLLVIEILFFMTVVEDSLSVTQLFGAIGISFFTVILGKFLGTFRRLKKLIIFGVSHEKERQKIKDYFSVDRKIED